VGVWRLRVSAYWLFGGVASACWTAAASPLFIPQATHTSAAIMLPQWVRDRPKAVGMAAAFLAILVVFALTSGSAHESAVRQGTAGTGLGPESNNQALQANDTNVKATGLAPQDSKRTTNAASSSQATPTASATPLMVSTTVASSKADAKATPTIAGQVVTSRGQALAALAERMRPRGLDVFSPGEPVHTRQFVHLHHMKTGGTSVSSLMNCALRRARAADNVNIPYYSLSECGITYYRSCVEGTAKACVDAINTSAVMTYCAPLSQVEEFGWLDADKITVLRDPVDRVWSMYRFRTKSCYRCMPLLDVYAHIDNGTLAPVCGDCDGVCIPQLLDHQTRNLLTTPESESLPPDQRLAEALYNMRNRFAVVGITGDLPNTTRMLGHVFPWLAEDLPPPTVSTPSTTRRAQAKVGRKNKGRNKDTGAAEENRRRRDTLTAASKCTLPHANGSPANNYCGPKGTHLPLPEHPDEATRAAIIAHNSHDVALYKAAVEHFELQKKVLGWEV